MNSIGWGIYDAKAAQEGKRKWNELVARYVAKGCTFRKAEHCAYKKLGWMSTTCL